eukprot:287348-Alexandrium_andersonii.AAC.1
MAGFCWQLRCSKDASATPQRCTNDALQRCWDDASSKFRWCFEGASTALLLYVSGVRCSSCRPAGQMAPTQARVYFLKKPR